jgi:hypothetical protein
MAEQRWVMIAGRVLVGSALFFGAWAIWFVSGNVLRLFCGIAALVFSGNVVAYMFGRGRRALMTSGIAVAVLALSPVEVSCATRAGLPGIVPVLRGLPRPAARERSRRGEVVLAGCMVTGFEPRWVVIW